MTYQAILLTSFGGPESPEEVMPFLERITAGRSVPPERLEEVSRHYFALGGVSPINAQNRSLRSEIQSSLAEREIGLPVYLGNRNSSPFYAEVLKQMYEDGHRKILSLVTSAYSSYSGCRQYRENLAQALIETELSGKLEIHKIRHYFDHPGFIEPFSQGLASAIGELLSEGLLTSEIEIFFTTHSIPISMAQSSGPPNRHLEFNNGVYVAQHNAAATCVMESVQITLGHLLPAWSLVYQSRSGLPTTPWLEPDIGRGIEFIAGRGKKAIVIVPIGFTSDHVEVIWDLDYEAKEIAANHGLRFIRVATPGVAKNFIEGIADLVEERLTGAEGKALSALGPWSDFCPKGCCPNARKDLATIAEG